MLCMKLGVKIILYVTMRLKLFRDFKLALTYGLDWVVWTLPDDDLHRSIWQHLKEREPLGPFDC